MINNNENQAVRFKITYLNNGRQNQQLNSTFGNRINFNFVTHNPANPNDRYIRIYKNGNQVYKIILSSGIFFLENSDNDLTYFVSFVRVFS